MCTTVIVSEAPIAREAVSPAPPPSPQSLSEVVVYAKASSALPVLVIIKKYETEPPGSAEPALVPIETDTPETEATVVSPL